MRICNVFRGVLTASAVLGLAGGAAAFDAKTLGADTAPSEALEFGLSSYRSGDKETAAEALGLVYTEYMTALSRPRCSSRVLIGKPRASRQRLDVLPPDDRRSR